MLNTKRGGRPRNFVTPQAVEMTEPWKRWKSQTAAFPPLPTLLGNLADGARFPHSHSLDDCFSVSPSRNHQNQNLPLGAVEKWKSQTAGISTFPPPRWPAAQGRRRPLPNWGCPRFPQSRGGGKRWPQPGCRRAGHGAGTVPELMGLDQPKAVPGARVRHGARHNPLVLGVVVEGPASLPARRRGTHERGDRSGRLLPNRSHQSRGRTVIGWSSCRGAKPSERPASIGELARQPRSNGGAEKGLPEASPVRYNIMCSGSGSLAGFGVTPYGRF